MNREKVSYIGKDTCGYSVCEKMEEQILVKYRRFVAYVYEYRKGKKENNCGFLRVEARDENVTVEVHLKCPGLPEHENCRIYGFIRKAGLMEGIYLGSAWSGRGVLDCMIESEKTEESSWNKEFMKFGGIIIVTENGAFFGTEWDDQSIKPENFEIRKCQKKDTVEKDAIENAVAENNITTENEAAESNITTENDKIAGNSNDLIKTETDIKSASYSVRNFEKWKTADISEENVNENARGNTNSVSSQEVNSSKSKDIPEKHEESQKTKPTFCPFDDGEITECRKLSPKDFFKHCPSACALRSNRFLEHGCYNFGHLLVGKRPDGQWILGVPGGYDQQERFMANMFGFPFFKESREIRLPGGRGGYWYRLINPSNFHNGHIFF